jgi:hypothetical protein
MTEALIAALQLIGQIAGLTTSSKMVHDIIVGLENIISAAGGLITQAGPAIQNIIKALQSNSAITAAQIQQLHVLDKAIDDAFDAASE